jgi:hypothetical protein
MNRRLIANITGWLGILCSLAYWAWVAVFPHLSAQQRTSWMRLDLGVSNVWPALWLAGFFLAIVSALIGSRRWIFAAIVPVLSCAAAVMFLSKVHP